mgnify:FL=1
MDTERQHAPSVFVIAALMLALLATGCVTGHVVEVDELTKVNRLTVGMTRAHSQGGSYAAMHEKSGIRLERTDGKTVRVKGRADVIVETAYNQQVRFHHPVSVTVEPTVLKIGDGGSIARRFRRDTIERVRVIQKPFFPFAGLFSGNHGGGVVIFRW